MISRLLFGCGLAFGCVLIGFMVAVLPFWFVIAIALVPSFFVLVAWRLEYGLLALLALVSGILHEAFLPSFSFLRAGDLAFFAIGVITIAGARGLTRDFHRSELALWIPFIAFLLLVPISVIYAHFFQGVSTKDVLGEGRHLMYLLLFPMLVAVLNTRERVHRFILGLVILGILFSLGQILQGIFHVRIFGDAGRLSVVETLGVKSYDATISSTAGIGIVLFVLFMVAGWYALKRIKTFAFLSLSALSAVGVLLTFGRTTWATTFLGIAAVIYLLGLRRSVPMLIWSLVGASLGFAMLIAVKPAMFDALVVRVTSVEREIESGSSAAWRYYELGEVMPQIISNPILGIGLGSAYRKHSPGDLQPENVRYIHSGYLYMLSKLGAPALALFVSWLLVVFSWSWRGAREEQDPELRSVHAAVCAAILTILVASITEPHLMRDASLALMGVLAGLTVALRRHGSMPARNERLSTAIASVAVVPFPATAKPKRA